MPMLENSAKTKVINSSIIWTTVVGIGLFMFVLLKAATRLSDVQTGVVSVTLGPLKLLEIQKNSLQGGGAEASFAAKSGLFIYMLLLLIICSALVFWRLRSAKHSK